MGSFEFNSPIMRRFKGNIRPIREELPRRRYNTPNSDSCTIFILERTTYIQSTNKSSTSTDKIGTGASYPCRAEN